METVAIFGGSFDPFTMAHRNIVEQVLRNHLADMVFIIPTVVNYHREGKEAFLNVVDKISIIKCLLEDIEYKGSVFVDPYELDLLNNVPGNKDAFQKRRRFIDTLVEFKMRYPHYRDQKIKFIIGTDEFQELDNVGYHP